MTKKIKQTKRRLTKEEIDDALEVYDSVEHNLRRLVEFLHEHGYDQISNRFGSSQLVTVKANENTGHNGVYVVRMVIPNTTGEKHKGCPLEKEIKLGEFRTWEDD